MLALDEWFVYAIFGNNDYTIDYYKLIECSSDIYYTLEFVKRELYDNDGWLINTFNNTGPEFYKGIYRKGCMKIRSYLDKRRYSQLIRYTDILQDKEIEECAGISKMEDICSDFYLENYVLPRFI